MSLLIDLILGPLGAALGVLVSVAAAFIAGRSAGRSAARAGAERDAAKEYRDTRKEIDDADLGLGASDGERIKRLRELADGR